MQTVSSVYAVSQSHMKRAKRLNQDEILQVIWSLSFLFPQPSATVGQCGDIKQREACFML